MKNLYIAFIIMIITFLIFYTGLIMFAKRPYFTVSKFFTKINYMKEKFSESSLCEVENGLSAMVKIQMMMHKAKYSMSQAKIQDVYRKQMKQAYSLTECATGERNIHELTALSMFIQYRIHRIQNPANCSDAKILIGSFGTKQGYGSECSRIMRLLILAYSLNRTLVLKPLNLRYFENGKFGWEDFHLPLSETCLINDVKNFASQKWDQTKNMDKYRVTHCYECYFEESSTINSIPRDVASVLVKYHRNPHVWWVAQFYKYVTRIQPKIRANLETIMKLSFIHPVIGIHFRTTDQVNKMGLRYLHPIKEYFDEVSSYLNQIHSVRGKGVIFIASDNSSMTNRAKDLYPDYTFISYSNHSDLAGSEGTRYTGSSLLGILSDVSLLSKTDYIICTFSSNIGRMSYALMQTMGGDRSFCVYSLDSLFAIHPSNAPRRIALEFHHATIPGERSLELGDIVKVKKLGLKLKPGYFEGTNEMTNERGHYPLNKTIEIINIIDTLDYTGYDKELIMRIPGNK